VKKPTFYVPVCSTVCIDIACVHGHAWQLEMLLLNQAHTPTDRFDFSFLFLSLYVLNQMSFSILAMRVRPWPTASRKETCMGQAYLLNWTYRFASPRDMLALPVGLSSVMASSSAQHVHVWTSFVQR
jgi:hypothetical protein